MLSFGKLYLDITERINDLAPTGKKIAETIIAHPEMVVNWGIEELAVKCGVSVSAIMRFCKATGYTGYKELCRTLAADMAIANNETVYGDIHPGDDAFCIFKSICQANIHAIESTLICQDEAQFKNAVGVLCEAQRIDFYGVGSSGIVALDAHNKFLRIGKDGMATSDTHMQLLSAASLKEDAAAVIISYSGETASILELMDVVKATGCKTISITSYGENSLNKVSDINLFSLSTETYIRSGAMSSMMSQITVIDALYSAVCSATYDEIKEFLNYSQSIINKVRTKNKRNFKQLR